MRNPIIKGKLKLEMVLHQEINEVRMQIASLLSLLKIQSNTIANITSSMTLLHDRIIILEHEHSDIIDTHQINSTYNN